MNCANHPDRERQAFCQNCGKPLCRECARTVGQAVFCEPCLEIRLAAANAATQASTQGFPQPSHPASGSATYQDIPGGQSYSYRGPVNGSPYTVTGTTPPPGTPNPVVAGLLGFIPGVGAMYNGQYGKGIVYLVIFAVLVSLTNSYGIFGLFIAIWIIFQAIEAYHTANARRDGMPLPNPFGFNDIGERFGFGRAWPTSAPSAASVPVPPAAPGPTGFSPAPEAPFPGTPGAQAFRHVVTPAPVSPMANPYVAAESTPRPDVPGSTFPNAPGTYSPVGPPVPPVPLAPASSPLPIGAIVLIGLGILFLFGNTHWLGALPTHLLLPALLIGVGVWIFMRRMLSFGTGLTDDGTPGYQLHVLQALQGSVWVILVGILFLLNNLRILSWGRSWPLFLIVAGVIFFLRRTATDSLVQRNSVQTPPPPTPYTTAVPPTPGSTRDAEQS